MSFAVKQRRSLAAKLKHRHVKTRSSEGSALSHLEGRHVIAEANRIFGHDNWDRQTLYPRCVWSDRQVGQTATLYSTKVRVTVRAGGDVVVREGIGTGFGRAPSEEAAHEIALKAAETDATKRALATFGNPFGLALYDKEQTGVTRPTRPAASPKPEPQRYVLCRNEGNEASFLTPQTFADVAIAEIRKLDSMEALYAFAKRNKGTFVHLRRVGPGMRVLMDTIGLAMSARAQVLRRRRNVEATAARDQATPQSRAGGLALPKERRVRNKEHRSCSDKRAASSNDEVTTPSKDYSSRSRNGRRCRV
jgi:hypothetical protein